MFADSDPLPSQGRAGGVGVFFSLAENQNIMATTNLILYLGAGSKYVIGIGAFAAALAFVIMSLQRENAQKWVNYVSAAAVFTGIFAAVMISGGGMLSTAVEGTLGKALSTFGF